MPAVALGTFVFTAICLSGLLVLVNRRDWWVGFLAASVVSILSAAISLVPLVWGLRGGMSRAPAGFLAATALRFIVSMGGCLIAVLAGGYPGVPTLVLMLCFYMALLGAEVFSLANTMWPASTRPKG